MAPPEALAVLRRLAGLAADQATADLARIDADLRRIQETLDGLSAPVEQRGVAVMTVRERGLMADWQRWRRARSRDLRAEIGCKAVLRETARTTAAGLHARVRAVDTLIDRDAVRRARRRLRCAERDGLPE